MAKEKLVEEPEIHPDRSKPLETRPHAGITFVLYDVRDFLRVEIPEPLGYVAEPLDNSVVGELSATGETMEDAINAISAMYSEKLKQAYGVKE